MPATNDPTALLDALDIASLAPEEQDALLADMNDLIFKNAMIRIIERMDEHTRDEFAALVDGGADEESIEGFLRSRVEGVDDAVAEAVQELSGDILAATGTNTN